jgi:1-acyl-sn-glycerol-3-phosphate acyltransferase
MVVIARVSLVGDIWEIIFCWRYMGNYLLLEIYSGKERALLICNHRSNIDWLVGWVVAQVAYP